MNINIRPLDPWMRATRFKPMHPPIFPDGEPTEAELRLAIALIEELDSASRAWYGETLLQQLRDRLPK